MVNKMCCPIAFAYDAARNGFIAQIKEEDTLAREIRDLAEANGFVMKEEFHITLIGYAFGARIQAALELLGAHQQRVYDQFIQEMRDVGAWSFVPSEDIWHIEEDFRNPTPDTPDAKRGEHREAYIQAVEVPMLADFYKQINSVCSLNAAVPPTHITLCTKGNDLIRSRRGIGVDTHEDLASLSPQRILFTRP